MKIEEAKDYVEENACEGYFENQVVMPKEEILALLDQIELDQPKLEVPQCVFDMIKEYKEEEESLYVAIYDADCFEKVQYWIDSQENGYDQFARAWLAYPNITVQKEKLYTVEIPDPNSKDTVYYLFKNEDGQVEIGSVLFLDTEPDESWRDDPEIQLTEAEIRKDFDWAWQWAEEVTE